MKISPKTERFLSRFYDKTENIFSWVNQVMTKVARGFSWLYLVGMSFVCLSQAQATFLTIFSHSFDPLSLVWLILTSGGLVALYSYLNNEHIGHTHFWKIWLVLTIIMYFMMGGIIITVFFLIIMLPTLYALYKLGFDDKFHQLLCLLKKGNIGLLDRAIYEKELKLPASSDAIYSWELLRFVITRLHIIPPIFKREA